MSMCGQIFVYNNRNSICERSHIVGSVNSTKGPYNLGLLRYSQNALSASKTYFVLSSKCLNLSRVLMLASILLNAYH